MRRCTILIASLVALLALPAAGHAENLTQIGTGATTCTLTAGADCRDVKHPWGVEHHGNLRGVVFHRADLRGADFRGADLRGADFRGAKLHHTDFRGANLKGAKFHVAQIGRAHV